MDRETRKANLKKLQLPGTATAIRPQRKTRQNTKTTNGATTTISNYFLTPEKQAACAKNVEPEENSNIPNNILKPKDPDIIVISDDPPLTSKPNTKRLKRTKLDAFIFKDPRNIPDAIKNCKTSLNDDDDEDLVVPEKKIKKAPKSTSISGSQAKQRGKSSKKKKQTTIKSAFLRNEQMFAEIAAQHCAADQFDGDDVQLALAISKSEAESKGLLGPEDMQKEDVVDLVDNSKDPDLIREKLKRYGFKTAEKKEAAKILDSVLDLNPSTSQSAKRSRGLLRRDAIDDRDVEHIPTTPTNEENGTRSIGVQTDMVGMVSFDVNEFYKFKDEIVEIVSGGAKENKKLRRSLLYDMNKLDEKVGYHLAPQKQVKTITDLKSVLNLDNPIDNLEEFIEFDKKIQSESSHYNNLREILAFKARARTLTEAVGGFVNVLMSHELQLKFSGCGKPNKGISKENFSATNSYNMLKDYTTFAAAFLPKANGRRIKSKWANKFTALTLRNNEVQTKKLQENIQTLLNQQFHTKALTEEEQNLSKYKLQSLLLKKCHIENNETFLDNFNNHKKTNEQYFVTDLFEITELSAGHLLKDWSVIQGRDLTPTTTKSQTSRERSIKLQNIYKDLEEYFSSRKRLEWTITDETKLDQENLEVIQETTQKDTNNAVDMVNIATNLPTTDNNHVEEELEELDDMIALIEHMQDNESSITQTSTNDQIKNILPPIKSLDVINISSCYELRANINTKAIEIIPTAEKNEDCADISDIMEDAPENNNSADEKLKNILPPTKSLDIMHVSSCTIRTEATFNSTQTRSNSPDLFADSDVEMEEEHKNVTNKDLNEMDVVKVNKSNSSLEDNVGVTSYEVYSSDEVKNTTSLKPNNQSLIRDTSLPDKILLANTMIDLTQDDLEKQDTQLNQSKVIVEPDLFADSPLQDDKDDEIVTDINSNSQLSKYIKEQKEEILKFTLSSEIADQEKDNQKDDYFKFTLSMETKKCDILENSKNDDSDDDEEIVLHEIAKDQTNSTFLNFQGLKQLETSFHKETATGDKKKQLKDSLSSNDTIFRELCNKYLNDVSPKPQKSNNKTDISLRTSFTQHLSKTKTPRKMENIMDIEMIMGNYKNIRKSNSFSTKTPKKSKYSNDDMLSKSQLFNKSDNSIDLTQNEEDDIPQDEDDDDDCLILSDDEINYSIWQANKTGNLNANKTCGNEEDDAISIPDFCITEKEEIKNDFIKDFPENNHKEFDYMDLLSKEESSIKRSSYEPPETLSVNNILASTITKDRKSSKLEFDRSEFGILEEYSEPIDFTPSLCTPRKQHLAEVSFLDSPTEKTDPMKRFSSCHKSTQKFNDLLRNIDKQSPLKNDFNELDDFDEFDRLIYQSPQYKSNSLKNPQGLEQLLTAEISFKASQYTSPAKKTPKKSKEFPSEKQELIVNNKTYTIRYTTSPKPDYTQFSESELLKQLYNFGIKPLKRKQAVKILEYIYNQTHPIVVDDELEEDDKNKYQLDDIITLEDFDQPSTSKSCLNSLSKISSQAELKLSDANVARVVENKLNLQDACGLDMLRYSIDLKAELLDENYVLQTNVTKKTPQPLLPFHIAWYNLVCSNPKLHETILMYEPVDLQQIYLFLKGLGYRYDPKDLKTFFDRRCIIFRYDLASAAGSNGKTRDNNRHVRKNKKPKSQTNKFK